MTEFKIKLDGTQFNEIEHAMHFQGSEIADAIRSVAEVDNGQGSAFIGIAEGLFSIASAIEAHTKYLKDREDD